ncbi:MAG: 7-cyano-7-deazaguanine synthase [Promethearchaeota archaeon]
MENKKLAITGANGYLGKHTIKGAIQKGWDVVGIVRRDDAAREVENLGAKSVIIKDFKIEPLKNAITGSRVVLHFRGVVCGSEEIFEEVNIQGMRVLIQAASEAKVSRIIFPSGLGVDMYGIEEWANDSYFHSKNVAEQILKNGNIPYIIFRPSYILGPEDELIPEIIESLGSGIVQIVGNGQIPMQPIFVKDAVEAFLAAADCKGEKNQVFDLVGSKTINMLQLVELVFKNMIKLGFNIPQPRINNIRFEDAPEQLGICKEMIDVMRCDITSNGTIAANALNFKLSDIEKAIEAAIIAKMFPEVKDNKKRGILLLSGGIDSVVALYWALHNGYEIIALSFNYNLRPEQEKKAVKKITDNLNIKLIEVPLQYVKEAIDLRIEGFPIPSAIQAPEGYIPSRNLVYYSIASYFAEIHGSNFIIGGHISVDPIKFPDADPSFFRSLEKLVNKGKHTKDKSIIKILLPLSKMTKMDVINLGKELNVPFNWTWSCYSDGDQPCGKCSSCRKRDNAFTNMSYSQPKFSL